MNMEAGSHEFSPLVLLNEFVMNYVHGFCLYAEWMTAVHD
jgi:hypothetical protein